ncbi:alpha-ketoacid dehydrogenase subunit beta [Pelagicoccus mobilis]|uniref:Transketolase-like pyrimidine-binding domain-containing protein n=1 Tax=Pelagicoccus mobilis TaxID=415221 RepID=A0A934RWR8_9BACT|nr:hypothetical protein [Pelagicoccus mobilis]MBK1878222.1 hypothetical protein [Pelagicoccus mobilis]
MSRPPTYLEGLQRALHSHFENEPKAVILGEDIVDPYGGAFKVTKGLSSSFPDRVFSMPICESSITGMGIGLALRGFKPVVELMFGDFSTLAADQLVNHAAKFPAMYGQGVSLPLVVRTPMGGGRGYGPTHSQSLEKMFLGIPNLSVVSPSLAHDTEKVLTNALNREEPTLFIESKTLYPLPIYKGNKEVSIESLAHKDGYPIAIARNYSPDQKPDLLIIAYGGASLPVLETLEHYKEEEIHCIAAFPANLSSPPLEELATLGALARRIVIADEGHETFSWYSELSHSLQQILFGQLEAPIQHASATCELIPSNFEQETEVILSKAKIEAAATKALEW